MDIGLNDFQILGALGYGGSSEVFLVRRSKAETLHAMKMIAKKMLGPRAVQQVVAENRILQQVRHPYIVPLHFSFQDDINFYLLFEYLGGGDLFHHLQARGPLQERATRILIAEVTLALDYLHTVHSVVYRDLKPENVLLTGASPGEAGGGHVVLTDFGCAKEWKSGSNISDDVAAGEFRRHATRAYSPSFSYP